MKLKNLKQFIHEASQATYASEDQDIRQVQADKSTTIVYEKGDWKYHDNYFGGEPYGGREVVFYKGKPVWMMVYYGWVVEGVDSDEVYSVLTKALRKSTVDMPYRGPEVLEDGVWRYENILEGDVENFSGVENILEGKKLLYTAKYLGGLVDR